MGENTALTRHLSAHARLTAAEADLLEAAAAKATRVVGPGDDIACEGDRPRSVKVMLGGWAMRYKQLADGRRQILAFLLPGDICDANAFLLDRLDHSLGAITPVRYADIRPTDFEALTKSPGIAKAVLRSELVALSIQREWTLNIGQRQAKHRIAHLFCEIFMRLEAIGLAGRDRCEFPLTQSELAEATGLTSVHVNRSLQEVRKLGLADMRGRRLYIRDLPRLKEFAMFDPAYLHLASDVVAKTSPLLSKGLLADRSLERRETY